MVATKEEWVGRVSERPEKEVADREGLLAEVGRVAVFVPSARVEEQVLKDAYLP